MADEHELIPPEDSTLPPDPESDKVAQAIVAALTCYLLDNDEASAEALLEEVKTLYATVAVDYFFGMTAQLILQLCGFIEMPVGLLLQQIGENAALMADGVEIPERELPDTPEYINAKLIELNAFMRRVERKAEVSDLEKVDYVAAKAEYGALQVELIKQMNQ